MERKPGDKARPLLAQITKDRRLIFDPIADTNEPVVMDLDEPIRLGINFGGSVSIEPVDAGLVNGWRELDFGVPLSRGSNPDRIYDFIQHRVKRHAQCNLARNGQAQASLVERRDNSSTL